MKAPIKILYKDEHCIIVSKPSHMLVHPYKECTDKTSLMKILKLQTGHFLYPIHRLDRPVSGIVIFGLNQNFVRNIKEEWRDSVEKKYLTMCRRPIYSSGRLSFDLSNEKKIKQSALTYYSPIKIYKNFTFLEVSIKTGRKHQIRRHFSRVCHNIVGDTKYGKGETNNFFRENFKLDRIFLHAYCFKFIHPVTKRPIKIFDPLPDKLYKIINSLE